MKSLRCHLFAVKRVGTSLRIRHPNPTRASSPNRLHQNFSPSILFNFRAIRTNSMRLWTHATSVLRSAPPYNHVSTLLVYSLTMIIIIAVLFHSSLHSPEVLSRASSSRRFASMIFRRSSSLFGGYHPAVHIPISLSIFRNKQ